MRHSGYKSSSNGWPLLALLLAGTIAVIILLAPGSHAAVCQTCTVDPGGCGNVGGNGFNPNDGGAGNDGCSPIIIDVSGGGFKLTSARGGVVFDMAGTGTPVQIAWTSPGSRNAFLVLDWDHDGGVTSGKELFGNFTPQPRSPHPNGFLALAEYDKPENGGNGDGVIDQKDAVFVALRLWIDANHDGIAQPGELSKLPDLGVYSISLNYKESRRTDQYGNQFRYRARINVTDQEEDMSKAGPVAYDVFFTTTDTK